MKAWEKSRDQSSAEKMYTLLCRMLDLESDTVESMSPGIDVYNRLLKACSITPRQTLEEKSAWKDPLAIAIDTFGKLRGPNGPKTGPSHASYAYMFLTCGKHMSRDDPRRIELARKLFQQCCRDGQVTSLVIETFGTAVPHSVFNNELGISKDEGRMIRVQGHMEGLPMEWKRNVQTKEK